MPQTDTTERKNYKRIYEQLAREYDTLEDESREMRTTLVHTQQALSHAKEVIAIQRELIDELRIKREVLANPFLQEVHP
jgi:hypothetical protein